MIYGEHILVVDDDPALLEQAEEILSPPYEVSLARTGAQAVDYLGRGGEADLILLDILMPEMDGYETLRAIRQMEACREIPVVFLTSLTDSESELQGLSSGAADFVVKPFDSRVLLARIQRRLQNCQPLDPKKIAALPEHLTPREWRVAKLLARSCSNEEICDKLHYALDTVKKLVSRVLEKLDIHSRKDIRKYCK